MKKLDNKVNIIPIIAKADVVSKSELHKFKTQVVYLQASSSIGNKPNFDGWVRSSLADRTCAYETADSVRFPIGSNQRL